MENEFDLYTNDLVEPVDKSGIDDRGVEFRRLLGLEDVDKAVKIKICGVQIGSQKPSPSEGDKIVAYVCSVDEAELRIAKSHGYNDVNSYLADLDRAGTPGSRISAAEVTARWNELNDLH